jgi:hypothetical protein
VAGAVASSISSSESMSAEVGGRSTMVERPSSSSKSVYTVRRSPFGRNRTSRPLCVLLDEAALRANQNVVEVHPGDELL